MDTAYWGSFAYTSACSSEHLTAKSTYAVYVDNNGVECEQLPQNEDKPVTELIDSLNKCAMKIIVTSGKGSNLTPDQCKTYFPGKESCGQSCMDFKVYTFDKSASFIKISQITAVLGMGIASLY